MLSESIQEIYLVWICYFKEKKIGCILPFFIHILHAFGPRAFVCVIIFVGSYSDSDLTNYTIRINIFCTIDIVNKMFNV